MSDTWPFHPKCLLCGHLWDEHAENVWCRAPGCPCTQSDTDVLLMEVRASRATLADLGDQLNEALDTIEHLTLAASSGERQRDSERRPCVVCGHAISDHKDDGRCWALISTTPKQYCSCKACWHEDTDTRAARSSSPDTITDEGSR